MPINEWDAELDWLYERLQAQPDVEMRANFVRQVRAGVNDLSEQINNRIRRKSRGLLEVESDPLVRIEIVHLLIAMADESVEAKHHDLLEKIDKPRFVKWLKSVDGHDVVSKDSLIDLGIPSEVVDALDLEFGEAYYTPAGVNAYILLTFICHQLGIKADNQFIGIGTHTSELAKQLIAHMDAT